MNQLDESNLAKNIREACKQFDGNLEAAFVRGSMGSGLSKKSVLIMLVGPRLTLKSLYELRAEILESFDAKEAQLKKLG